MTACASILCDNCAYPGHCCSGFTLLPGKDALEIDMLISLATVQHGAHNGQSVRLSGPISRDDANLEHVQLGLPFMPQRKHEDGYWRFSCFMLDENGRCGDYENRPALCRSYKSGSDGICVMHHPAASALDTPDNEILSKV
jgi:Fe-S-cluster containining protein